VCVSSPSSVALGPSVGPAPLRLLPRLGLATLPLFTSTLPTRISVSFLIDCFSANCRRVLSLLDDCTNCQPSYLSRLSIAIFTLTLSALATLSIRAFRFLYLNMPAERRAFTATKPVKTERTHEENQERYVYLFERACSGC
jgi:hypothetical protein